MASALETKNLALSPLTPDDLAPMQRIWNAPEMGAAFAFVGERDFSGDAVLVDSGDATQKVRPLSV